MTGSSAAHDFDFLHGSWRVEHHRLTTRLAGADEWDDFGGTCTAWPILGGQGNIDDNVLELPARKYRASSLRTFDPSTETWSIWWLDARDPHSLDDPVVGQFDKGVGEFIARSSFNEQPIVVRFRWTDMHTPSPLWEQSFSPDIGTTWEKNWTMRFHRNG